MCHAARNKVTNRLGSSLSIISPTRRYHTQKRTLPYKRVRKYRAVVGDNRNTQTNMGSCKLTAITIFITRKLYITSINITQTGNTSRLNNNNKIKK